MPRVCRLCRSGCRDRGVRVRRRACGGSPPGIRVRGSAPHLVEALTRGTTAQGALLLRVMTELPTGTVTFVFTDIEGSTRLLQELGDEYGPLQDAHAAIMRSAIGAGGGVEIRTEGDSFFAVFPTPSGAVAAAVAAQRELASFAWPDGGDIRVRMGLHTGEGVPGGDDYVGIDVNRAARIASTGH